MYPAGSSTASATYTPSVATPAFIAASGAGEVAAIHFLNGSVVGSGAGSLTTDVWDVGKSGAPSRTLTTSAVNNTLFVMAHEGTLYLPDRSSAGVPQYDLFPAGASTPSKIIPETIVPASQYANFSPNYAAVGPDGTLYITEYTFQQPDPLAGVYIYPLNGAERFIPATGNAQGVGPQGIDVDASGNIYVVNNNSAITSSTTCQGDTLQNVTVYSPTGTLLRTVSGGDSAFPITVAADGTAFFSTFPFDPACAATTNAYGIYSIAPGATTSTQIATSGSTEIVLYDGTHKTNPFLVGGHRAAASHAGVGSVSRGSRRLLRKQGSRF
ncbi:MAG: hypothetical protein IAI49_11955 [Candidatus Eremiobacteraeota bacterium]|nr:hypothetical protein [Candidatus Eremiobacteraeota bacterium]